MQPQFFQTSKSAPTLRRVHWTKTDHLQALIPHTEMLDPEGLIKQGTKGAFLAVTDCVIVYDYTYVLDKIPKLRSSIPSSLVPGSEAYLEALRLAFEEYQSNQKIETWADVIKTLRCRLKMSVPDFAARLQVSDTSVWAWENGSRKPVLIKVSVKVLAAIKNYGGEELLEKTKQIALAEYRSKLDSLI